MKPAHRLESLCAMFVILAIIFSATSASRGQSYESLFSFTDARAADLSDAQAYGYQPLGDLLQGVDGNFYGTNSAGGGNGFGTVFRMTPAGALTTLVAFSGNGTANKGSEPQSGLVRGGDGFFYGTTLKGGADNLGTVFRTSTFGALTTLVEFTGNGASNKGGQPKAALVLGPDGNFYGSTQSGGAANLGTIFKITPAGVLSTLIEFTGNGITNKGSRPQAALTLGLDLNFYGTTQYGGAGDKGTVFKLSTDGTPAGTTFTTLLEFTGNGAANKGSQPAGILSQLSNGDFYGTTQYGGAAGCGTIFRMTSAGALTTLLEFDGTTLKGRQPISGLKLAGDGSFVGTTYLTSSKPSGFGKGTVFRVTTDGTAAGTTLTSFFEFNGTQSGTYPQGGLILGADGNFYGTTSGKPGGLGTVFKITPVGTVTTLAAFTGGTTTRGKTPNGLLPGSDGNFRGSTASGGEFNFGTLFTMSGDGTLGGVLDFSGDGVNQGSGPAGKLTQGADGDFYGVTEYGGNGFQASSPASGLGTIFKVTPSGTLTTLVAFSGTTGTRRGGNPSTGLLLGLDGSFYGTTTVGGTSNLGTVFRMSPPVVRSITGCATVNQSPQVTCDSTAGLTAGMSVSGTGIPTGAIIASVVNANTFILGSGGIVPIFATGTQSGLNLTALSLTFTTLVDFTGNGQTNKGSHPKAELVQGADGNFYGATSEGGASDLGTIFQMTPGGTLTTLLSFTGNGATNKGAHPGAGLITDPQGVLHGTTSGGGSSDNGTVFRLNTDGTANGTTLTTLVEFTDNQAINKGAYPGELAKANDGNFYGTTYSGGESGSGTLYRMTPAGTLTTLVQFNIYGDDHPNSLISGVDGNLYGTTTDPDGGLFRLVFPGAPLVTDKGAQLQGLTSFLMQAGINPRGSVTTVSLEYGTDGSTFDHSVPVASQLTGNQTQLTGVTLAGLYPGTVHYYRFRAVSSAGTTLSPTASFSTLAAPMATADPASSILSYSARFNGTVNARTFATTVTFQWGTDGVTFPNLVQVVPGTVTGNTPQPVTAAVAGLTKGVTYFYRIVARNEGGTDISGTQSFTSLTESVATLGSATILSTTRVQVNGTVNPKGSDADVSFEYGTDGIFFPNSFSASPATVNGSDPVAVTATLTGLVQGTTYYYRIRSTGPGGTGLSETGTFSLGVLSGLVQVFPDPPPPATGTVTINFSPPTRGGWRFAGETAWRSSGVAATNLVIGPRLTEFLPVAGYISPPNELLDVTLKKTTLARLYYQTTATESGSLTVFLKPSSLGAMWRRVGTSTWHDSGGTPLTGLAAGTHLIECMPVAGQVTPPTSSITIKKDQSSVVTLTYYKANDAGAAAPQPLSFDKVSADEDSPFAYVGQIRTEVGSSTGFVVKRRVVATAGHVVFDDGSLSFITGMQWLFQRHSGEYEPTPQVPRGNYLAAGYADQRIADNSPGEGSAASQRLDYAALYFLEEAGRGGYGGYLASDSGADNEFLKSITDQKILAGYAVEGIPAADEGKLHATEPFTGALTPTAEGVTWTTTAVRGFGGCSGGPLFVQRSNGLYLPAAIYLGGNGQTVVRAIDSSVVELFLRAEVSGNGGDNNTGGGITHSDFTSIGAATQPGALVVNIQPAAARDAGAGWRLKPETSYRSSGSQKSGLSAGTYQLQLATVSGFQTPTRQTVTVNGGQLQQVTFTYAGAPLIAIEQPAGTQLTDGAASISFESAAVSSATTKTFTIRNLGRANLKKLKITIDGKDADEFKVSPLTKSTLDPGANEKFDVTFTPVSKSRFNAAIHIASNDAAQSPFDIKLTGTGVAKAPTSPALSGIARLPSWMDLYANGSLKTDQAQLSRVIPSVVTFPDGSRYRALTVETTEPWNNPRVEVSSNLVEWYSGNKHTTVLLNNGLLLKVRDNTPFTSKKKRFIRVSSP